MLKKVYNALFPMMPLKGYEKEDEFKIYGSDIGSKRTLPHYMAVFIGV